MKKFVALVVVGALAWFAHQHFTPNNAAEPAFAISAPSVVEVGADPLVRWRGAVVDPSGSTASGFRAQILAELADAVGASVPPKPASPQDGVEEVPGLTVVVTFVGDAPLAYGASHVNATIPGVPALPARPALSDETMTPGGAYSQWKDAQTAWEAAYDSATQAALDASLQIRDLEVPRGERSGITSAVTALGLLLPQSADAAILVASDLAENVTRQSASLGGAPVVVIQPFIRGDVERAQALYDDFSAWVGSNNGGTTSRHRPEESATTISSFIGQGG